MKILLVEDELGIQQVVKAFLQSKDAEVDVTHNGDVAFNMVKDNDYDIVLFDNNLEGMTGEQAVTAIEKENIDCKVIVNTAYGIEELKSRLKDSKIVVGFIAKPFDLKVLWETIQENL